MILVLNAYFPPDFKTHHLKITPLMFFQLPEKEVVKVFGRNLKKLRLQRKLSMDKLAKLADMELSQIYRIENGRVNAKLTTIAALGKALDIDPNELLKVPNLPND